MLHEAEIKLLLEKIMTHKNYGGDLEPENIDTNLLLSDVLAEHKNCISDDYIYFLKTYGAGTLDASFFIDFHPRNIIIEWGVPEEDQHQYQGYYEFASNLGGVSFHFNSNDNGSIAEHDCETDEFTKIANTFPEFIYGRLQEIITYDVYNTPDET